MNNSISKRNSRLLELLSGLLLLVFALAAMIASNSSLSGWYDAFLETPLSVSLGQMQLKKPLYLWINDGLMVLFFFSIALEIKSEYCQKHFSNVSLVLLPILAACGGMLAPALCYTLVTYSHPLFAKGWAIPIATDIAFSLGMLSLFGARVPMALKMFLMTLCVFDDIGAIVVIGIFHSTHLVHGALISAAILLGLLTVANRLKIESIPIYLFLGFLLWLAILESGINSTISGVLLGMFIPFKRGNGTPLIQPLLKDMQPFLTFFVLPLFAFANAGVSLAGFTPDMLIHPITLGCILGLFVGKQLGIFATSWVYIKIMRQRVGFTTGQLYATSCLCGVGFTMSLFIGSLDFGTDPHLINLCRLGVLCGSMLSIADGLFLLRRTLPRHEAPLPLPG